MFGYHNSNHCSFDLWSLSRESAVENRAFSGYAFHTQQLEDVVDAIANGSMNIEVSDDFSSSDLTYIKRRLHEKYGITAELEFS